MSHYYAQQHQHQRPRPEPLALGGTESASHAPPAAVDHAHRARLLSSLRSAPLPHQNHNYQGQYQYQQQQQQHSAAPYAPQVQAAAEFQHAQTAYLAELAGLQRTIEQQIIAQQQLERDAAYRLLAAQRQGQGRTAPSAQPQFANYPPAPHQQLQQGPYSAGVPGGRGFAQQQFAPTPIPAAAAQQQANNPLVASALARRQRQDHAQYTPQPHQQRSRGSPSPHGRGPRGGATAYSPPHSQPQSRSASREQHLVTPPHQRSSPPPPAVILSAPGEPYPDTSSSGSESGETRPSSPDAALLDAAAKRQAQQQQQQQQQVKASRRRSHLDALAGLGHAVEQRKGGGGAGVAVATRARPASSSFAPPPGDFYAGQFVPGPAPAHAHAYGHRSVSDTHAVLSSHALAYAPSPSPAASPPTTTRYAPPPVPGTASAVRQPRGPPTELTDAANFASRVRARAIESLRRGARGARGSGASGEGGGEGHGQVPSLATVQAAAA